jgi:hypothetical protein
MARLIVLRGETVDRKIDLITLPVRIGRGQKNDVVLDDPMKGISRDHAEIRMIDDRYVLVDLESENGIWVSGRRVPEVVLAPNVVASIGPFRLMVADEAPVPATDRIPVTPPPRASTAPPPIAAPKPRTAAPPPNAGAAANRTKWLIGAAVGVILLVAFAAPFFLFSGPEPVEVVETPDVSGPIADAERQSAQGLCTEALATIDVALQRYPNNTELIGARRRAEGCVPAVTPAPAPPPLDVNAELQAARDLVAVRDCAGAMSRIDAVLAAQPDSPEALEVRKQAIAACTAPTVQTAGPAPVRKDPPAAEIAAENGGLTPLPNELDRDYQARVKSMRERYDEAVAAAAKGPTPAVVTTYEGLLRDTSPRYLDVAARLADARKGLAAGARQRQKEALALEQKESWDEAIARLRDAKAMDPSLSVDGDISRMQGAKLARGEDACRAARQAANYPNAQAKVIESYRLVVRHLPQSHACYGEARSYLDGVRQH